MIASIVTGSGNSRRKHDLRGLSKAGRYDIGGFLKKALFPTNRLYTAAKRRGAAALNG